ncbi:MAG: dual specificity protein phosphatase family protein [Candidatus Latescibacteria bacterium]|nr:dual specificity protein phosphatase family protein [Candidatus Latescibacterota bacterium]
MGRDEYLAEDLAWLGTQGVGALVSLTEEPLDKEVVCRYLLHYLHLPIEDMHAPSLAAISTFVGFVDQSLAAGCPVVVHCRAGMGRTGTMLACYLVHREVDPQTALAQVRQQRPGSVETWAQEMAVYEYAAHRRAAVNWSDQVGMN